jgi:hypothetical protein
VNRRRRTTALVVLAAGVLVSLTADVDAASLELVAFAFVALCAAVFLTRPGALILTLGMALLAVSSNQDIASTPGPTGREIGTATLIALLYVIAVIGVCVDAVAGLVWRSTRWRPPPE